VKCVAECEWSLLPSMELIQFHGVEPSIALNQYFLKVRGVRRRFHDAGMLRPRAVLRLFVTT
jgi:hypothetical protein